MAAGAGDGEALESLAQRVDLVIDNVGSNLPETNASIDRIMRDARAADEVVQHVRALFKRQSFDKQNVTIPDILSEAVRFVREDPKKRDVPIDVWFDEHLPTVSADLTQMQHVFINLISNAIEATEDGHLVPRVMVRASATDQHQMLIQVIDNGPGVGDPERIFDAFVTTKKNGIRKSRLRRRSKKCQKSKRRNKPRSSWQNRLRFSKHMATASLNQNVKTPLRRSNKSFKRSPRDTQMENRPLRPKAERYSKSTFQFRQACR